jgi:hypothetical protein
MKNRDKQQERNEQRFQKKEEQGRQRFERGTEEEDVGVEKGLGKGVGKQQQQHKVGGKGQPEKQEYRKDERRKFGK